MYQESQARKQANNNVQTPNNVELSDGSVQRSIKLGESSFCECAYCNTCHDIEQHTLTTSAINASPDATQTSYGNATRYHCEEMCPSPLQHVTIKSKVTLGRMHKDRLKVDPQIKHVRKQITKKYLQIIKRIKINIKNTLGKVSLLKSAQREINQTVSSIMHIHFNEKHSELKKESAANFTKNRISNTRKRCKGRTKISTKNTALKLIMKLKILLKSYIHGVINKSQTCNNLRRCNHNTCYEHQPVVFNYIFPYRCSSSDIIEEISDTRVDKSCEVNVSSTIIFTSDSSTESFNDHLAQIRLVIPTVHSNMHRSDNVLSRDLKIDTKTNGIKTLRRVTLKRQHKHIVSKSYRQNFNKKYQTYFAEISYRNQVLQRSPPCRQAVNIGSTWDCNIDFGRSTTQGFPENGDNLGKVNGIKTETETLPLYYQCPPGACTTGKCDPKQCYKRLKKSAPYGSHATTQSRKHKLARQRALRSGHGRRKSNGKQIGKRREVKNDGNNLSLSFPELPQRQKVRIGSKHSFNVKLYKQMPLGAVDARSDNRASYRDGIKQTTRHKAGRTRRNTHSGTATDHFLTGSSHGSQVGTQSRKIRGRYLRAGRETFYKDKSVSGMPMPKPQLKTPSRQAVRIGSKFSFNVEFYKSMPQRDFMPNEHDQILQLESSEQPKTGDRKKYKSKTKYQCQPGVCIPGQCNANACFQQLKSRHSQSSYTGSSKGTSQGSQASTKSKNKRQLLSESATFYRDRGSSSMPRPRTSQHLPNRQAVRIGSKCSFNIEFYRSMPFNGYGINKHAQGGGETYKPRMQCEPGVCIPGKCNAKDCFQTLKAKHRTSGTDSSLTGSSNVTSQGSQAITKRRKKQAFKGEKATFYKDKGLTSMPRPKTSLHLPNRQAVRIGSKCSFNIEFYRIMPFKGYGINEHALAGGETHKPRTQCEPGVCIPGKCNANECFISLKAQQSMSGSSEASTNAMSQSSQVATRRHKNKGRENYTENGTFFRDKGVLSMPVAKNELYKKHRQAVRIASKCSFNIEFYKSMPQNGFVTRDYAAKFIPIGYHGGDAYTTVQHGTGPGRNINPRNNYECDPGVCIPGQCNAIECLKLKKTINCKPKTCVPGKCDPRECYRRLNATPMGIVTDTSYTGSSNPAGTQSRKLKGRQLRAGKETIYKEKGISSIPRQKQPLHVPNRQAVRIGSNYSFNIEFYKAMPQKGPMVGGQNYEPTVNLSNDGQYNQGNRSVRYRQITGRTRQTLNKFECEPKVCVPGKCDPRDCYQRLKGAYMVAGNDGSFTDSSYATSHGSKAFTKQRKNKLPDSYAGNATSYRDRGAPRPKTPLKRQAVRIGSTNSFNVELYKNKPHGPGKGMPRFQPYYGHQIQNMQYPEQYYPSSTETGEDQSGSNILCECFPQIVDLGKKHKTKKKKPAAGKHDEGDALIHKKILSSGPSDQSATTVKQKEKSETKKKATKGKTAQTRKSLDKTINQQIKQDKAERPTTEKKREASKEKSGASKEKSGASKEKRTASKEKNPQIGQYQKSHDQGDTTTVHRDVGTEKKKEKPKRIKQAVSIGRINDEGEKGFEYELGVCIPNKCDPYLCFERLRNKRESASTDASTSATPKYPKATQSSSAVSKATSVNLERGEEAERRKQARASTVYRNSGTSSTIITAKNREEMMQPISAMYTPTPDKKYKNVVRIGSSCSFNIQFFREKPLDPSQASAIRSANISPKSSEQTKENNGFLSYFKKCCRKFKGKAGETVTNDGTSARQSQTRGLECVPGLCNFDKCIANECPAKMALIDAAIGTQMRAKSAMPSYSTNAATQSRRYPLVQQAARYEKSFSSALCRACGHIAPSRGPPRLRNMPVNDYMPLGSNMGYGDNLHGCQVREQAVIIGSGCGFNVNFFKKRK